MKGAESFNDFRLFADTIPQIVYSARPSGGMEYFNRAWYRYTGQTPDEALVDGWVRAVHPDDVEQIGALWQRARETGETLELEFRIRRKDGAYRWFFGRGEAVRDEAGAIVRWYGGSMDINDFKVADQTVRHHAARLRRIANALPHIVWITDGAGKNTYLNDRWYAYTGLDPHTPHELARIEHPDDHPKTTALWQRSLATGDDFETEYRLRGADGAYRWFLGRAMAVRGPDETIEQWFGSCTDIEDRKRVEADVREAYEREHRIATTLQRAFLTHRLPEVPGFRFDAVYRPAEREAEVGGDWFDAIELDDGRIVLSIGDVAGHGLDAAILMGNVRQSIRAIAQVVELDPVAMLDAADRSLRREAPDALVTAFIGILDPRARTLTFASAGHPRPLLLANGELTTLASDGLPLGLRHFAESTASSIVLPARGMLVLFTDGLVESTRDLAEGERRLIEAIRAVVRDVPKHPAQAIEERVLRDGARDDVAILTMSIDGGFHVAANSPEQVA